MTRSFVAACLLVGVASAQPARLRKAELRPVLKTIVPSLEGCYARARARDPQIGGVINTRLVIDNEPGVRLTMTVEGFDTSGRLGQSRDFLACVKQTIEARKYAPTATRGRIALTYPSTFSTQPVDNRDRGVVDVAARALDDKRWKAALAEAERGLESTSLDGTYRRRLIEIAGTSACRLGDEVKARHFYALSSPEFEDRLVSVCSVSKIDLLK